MAPLQCLTIAVRKEGKKFLQSKSDKCKLTCKDLKQNTQDPRHYSPFQTPQYVWSCKPAIVPGQAEGSLEISRFGRSDGLTLTNLSDVHKAIHSCVHSRNHFTCPKPFHKPNGNTPLCHSSVLNYHRSGQTIVTTTTHHQVTTFNVPVQWTHFGDTKNCKSKRRHITKATFDGDPHHPEDQDCIQSRFHKVTHLKE